MSIPNGADTEAKLPRRDWILIPAIGLLTLVAVCGVSELVAKRRFAQFEGAERCPQMSDPWIGLKRSVNCTYVAKASESPATEYRINSSGYRENSNLTPKQPGTFRIVMAGTSYGYGLGVPREKTISALLPEELSKRTGRKVELYNESLPGFPGLPQNLSQRFDDVLAPQPDLILWQMTRWDIKANDLAVPDAEDAPTHFQLPTAAFEKVKKNIAKHSLRGTITSLVHLPIELVRNLKDAFSSSDSALMIKSALNQSPSQFIKSFITGSDSTAGYIKANESPFWSSHTEHFDSQYAAVTAKAKAANVPLVLVVWPTRAQAIMISNGEWPSGYDPYRLSNDIHAIVAKQGGVYMDVFPDFKQVPGPEKDYLAVDGHPTAAGNAALAGFLAKEMTNGSVPELAAPGAGK